MKWVYDDGGREKAGYKGHAGDCVVRSIAIATKKPYQEVYDELNELSEDHNLIHGETSSSRNGTSKEVIKEYLKSIGAKWTATMLFGQGCKVHLKAEELPKGRLVVSVSKHLVAVIDGVIHDLYDPSRDEKRCVYGYWTV